MRFTRHWLLFVLVCLLGALSVTPTPTGEPSSEPTSIPSGEPSGEPTSIPSGEPSSIPTGEPSGEPTGKPSGEPSSMPSGEPSGEPSCIPTGEPSSQPSDQPSSQPSGQPTTEPTGQPTGQPTSEPSGQPTGEPSGQPSGQPTGEPSGQPTDQPTGEPSGQPTSEPTGQPTDQPTGEPSGQPTSEPTGQPTDQPTDQPSGQPTGQPSSHPTFVYPMGFQSFAGGGNNSSPVVWSVDSLGFADRGGDAGALYLTVDVWPSHFEVKGLEYATVKVNGIVVDQYCTPDEECGTDFYTCFYDMDVQSYIQEPLGGVLSFEVSSTGVPHTVCDHMGYSLYARLFLREALPTGQPTSQPSDQPSGQPTSEPTSLPTGQPSAEPSSQPSSCPTADPSGEPSGEPSGGPSSLPSGEPTGEPSAWPTAVPSGEPSGQPSGQPTALPSSCPSGEPSGEPSGVPSGEPSGEPSAVPSGEPSGGPSGVPSGEPSGEPSGVPSSHPTLVYPLSLSYEGGGNDSHPVVWETDSVGYVGDTMPLYLSVEIYPTDYEIFANQYATIKVNGNTVDAHCTPDESCGSVWYSCISEYDVKSLKSEELGGKVVVEVSSTGLESGPCNYLGHALYTRMFLREALPTGEPTVAPSGEPSGAPSCTPTGEPTGQPSGEPSGEPSATPSAAPSSSPTGEPSGNPTVVPTSHPTLLFPHFIEMENGGDSDNPVVFELNNVGHAGREVPTYLTVSVMETDFLKMSSQWATVKINGKVVIPYCTPRAHCTESWHHCMLDADVTDLINATNGGSLSVEVSSFGVETGPCDHIGFPLYAKVVLTEEAPTETEEISINLMFAAAIAFFLLMIFILCVVIWHKRRSARVYIMYEGNSRDFCLENEDIGNTNGIDLALEQSALDSATKPSANATGHDNYDIESIQ